MDYQLFDIATSGSYLTLAGLLAGALFFGMVALRDLGDGHLESLLFLALSAFFAAAHVYYLTSLPREAVLLRLLPDLSLWAWLVALAAPVIIVLFVALGLFSFAAARTRAGLVRLFFGLTLLCFLYMLGHSWPTDVKAMITIVYMLMWFDVELVATT